MAITVVLSGGLGNQMFQYCAGRALSLRHNTRLVIDLRFYPKANKRDAKSPWILDFPIAADRVNYRGGLLHSHSFPRRLYRNFISEPSSRKHVQSELGFYPDFFSLPDGTVLLGNYQSPRYFIDYWEGMKDDFDPSQLPLNDGNIGGTGRAELHSCVGVHVRRGDYLEHAGFSLPDPERYYSQAISQLRQRLVGNLIIFSDDMEWCKANPVFAGATFYSSNAAAPYHDLFAMAQCGAMIIANSTFSWWAGWLAHKKGARVVAPEQWILGLRSKDIDILPVEWTVA